MPFVRFTRVMTMLAVIGMFFFIALNRIIPKYADCGTSIALLTAAALIVNSVSCAVALALGRKLTGKSGDE